MVIAKKVKMKKNKMKTHKGAAKVFKKDKVDQLKSLVKVLIITLVKIVPREADKREKETV